MGRCSHFVGSVPGLGSKLPQAAQHGKKKKKKGVSGFPIKLPEGLVDCFLAK